jgi:aldehyde:ferredoxin oxidoreductase
MAKVAQGGYAGKILRINLSGRSVSSEPLDEKMARRYLGGAGFIAYYLWKELKQGADSLGPDNKLIFALGPVTGVSLPGSARNCIGAKSPMTGGYAKSEVGGFWGAELKRAGYDMVIVEGKAEQPVYLWIQDGQASIRDARHLWGKSTKETQQAIREELADDKIRIASIGLAGENLVRYACIICDLRDASGRGGLGAVMGSKNLKAVAVRGQTPPKVADPERLKGYRDWILESIKAGGFLARLGEFGTGGVVHDVEIGNLTVRNWNYGDFPHAKDIDGPAIKDTIRIGMDSCFACPVHCKRVVKFEEPYRVDPDYGGPEFETLSALGSNCGIDNLKAIAKGNELCNAYGMDTISAGSTIAFAMECFEKGLLSSGDTDGVDLRFGNADAMLKMIEMIARRKGIGNILAEGVARAAKNIGKGAEDFAVHVKGLEPGQHEPRVKPGHGLGFMINPHGADHCHNIHDTNFVQESQLDSVRQLGFIEPVPWDDLGPRKVALMKAVQAQRLIYDALGLCRHIPFDYEQTVGITKAVTGWDTSLVEQIKATERILTVARLFNIREGLTAADDVLPKRYFEPRKDGKFAENALDPAKMEKAKQYYYMQMGWDTNGVPTPEKLEELYII